MGTLKNGQLVVFWGTLEIQRSKLSTRNEAINLGRERVAANGP